MINTAVKFLNSALPISIAVGGLNKIDPRFKKFFSSAALAGYGTDAALDYLRDKFEGEGHKQETSRLEERQASGNARPDELQALRTREQNAAPANAIQKGISFGAGLTGGLAGLAGMGANAAAGSISGQGEPEQPEQPNPQQPSPVPGQPQPDQPQQATQDQSAQQNDMMQNSLSEIISHIKNRMSHGGRSLEEAAHEVGSHKQFRPVIEQIEQSGIRFMDWVKQQLGGQQGQQGQKQSQGEGAQRLMALLQSRPKR